MLTLRNPHSVLAAIATRPDALVEVQLPGGRSHGAWERVVSEARRLGRPVRTVTAEQARTSRGRTPQRNAGGRSGAEATLHERPDVPLDALFRRPATGAGLWLALDEVQDPHNVGAIFRAAAFFGIRGIVMTDVRAAPLTSVVYDVASGGVEAVPFAVETNLRRSLDAAKGAGIWVLGTSEHAERDVADMPHDRPWLLVLGNEESGLRRLTLETCDEVCRITPGGDAVTSLNVSVAAGILIASLSR
ncbi:MAG: RNA methyltransferase [Chloroflexi bacterium]|nr:RNA methyltransferase [Chloroflexota bacterium]